MSTYVPGFTHDIFLSYSHANNAEGWVSTFRRKLEARLKERIGEVTFFRDAESLAGNAELTPEILSGIRGAAILVSVVSQSYLSRPWCQKECREFVTANADRDISGRIFAVRYDDVSPAQFQKFVGEVVGYEFFAKTGDDKYADTLDPECDAFKVKMNNLRIEIGEKLKELKERANHPGAGSSKTADPKQLLPTVFLAEPAPGLSEMADQLTSYLRSFRYDVVRPGERFHEREAFESAFVSGLGQSLLFVQLLGRKFDPHDDDGVQSWDRWQYLQAQAAGLPARQWFNKYDKEGNEIDLRRLDADHREFVTQPGVWDCDWQRFREIVRTDVDKRFHDLRQQERITSGGDGLQPLVVLRADRSDKVFAERIGQTLKQLNCDWLRVPDRDVGSLEDFAREYAANGLIVVYRACPGKWVLTRLQELRKFLQTDFGRRWACGLWRAPDDDEDALSFSVDGLFVIEPHEPRLLEEFVMQLRIQSRGVEGSV